MLMGLGLVTETDGDDCRMDIIFQDFVIEELTKSIVKVSCICTV